MSTSEAAVRERLTRALQERGEEIADRWVELQMEQALLDTDIGEAELREEADALIEALVPGLHSGVPVDRVVTSTPGLHEAVVGLSLRRARAGATPTATSLAVLALKEALLKAVQRDTRDAEELFASAVFMNRLLDVAGALSFETYVEGREEIIRRQSQQLMEQSTPVVRLWRQVLAVPLIGTLDTARTQVVMENLLQAIQDHEALVAIVDITGVPTVDTAVAQHLMQTVNAVRLMGADCVISGVRPSIAQTIAQLGIDLSTILTRGTLADALAAAIKLIDGPGPDGDEGDGR
ncbi:STAS domain-containing protein [Streptomyces malaysiensis]|uniref:STAS domain-containing protein n=2 Tax=Streptomyces TaxID=1883 RepID=A0ABX6W945_STRMQ|nr:MULTISPECIES: STAS domain-containing protein [Streptomyces]AQA13409.1 anti-anti-sigma factor [Streptomyces autolyticus]MCC4320278.1 STAS domain-containing protein [Streptomyces malaysiensis]MCM3810211.1 STAS domain-containing protein [Streptomyces sp. DR7-3]QDL71412.1 STAS domain-containing protein [Streptomyces malaysiensis]QPI57982.1 STAS domain-containing protein [Streptomyces solisilvae]